MAERDKAPEDRDPNLVFQEYQEERRAEWETYEAAADIYVGTALGYREGDPVAKSTAERMNWNTMGLVRAYSGGPKDTDAQAGLVAGPAASTMPVMTEPAAEPEPKKTTRSSAKADSE